MSQMLELLGLPAEMREMVYDFAFAALLEEADPVDILLNRLPGAVTLRSTCKYIYADTKRSYLKAEAACNKKRQAIIDTTIRQYRELDKDVPILWGGINLQDVAQGLTVADEKTSCMHECRQTNCYMCNDAVHHRCFHCGRNMVTTLYFKLHTTPSLCSLLPEKERVHGLLPPPLLIPDSQTQLTALGRTIKRLETSMGCDYALHGQSKPDVWAYTWWRARLQDQRAVDIRCNIRRLAVQKHWAYPVGQRPAFCESNIRQLEGMDRRMRLVVKVRPRTREWTSMWKSEYERRVKEQAVREGVDVESLIPRT